MKKLLLLFIFLSGSSFAQESCNALLKHGIVERIREQKIDNQSTLIQNQICDSYNSYKSDSKNAGAKGNYGAFGGSASYSGTQIETIGKLMCESNLSDSASKALLETSSEKISPDAVNAWRVCTDQFRDGLRAETDFRNDNGTVSISIRYASLPGTNSFPEFSGFAVSPSNAFVCKGSLAKIKAGAKFSTDSLSMLCERDMTQHETAAVDGGTILVPAATISIMTTAGTITRHVSPVFKSPPPPPQRLAEIVSSMLDEGNFRRINGDGWVLADGRPVPNTAYAKNISPNVPDLRGVFLRGKNYDREKTSGNADGDLTVGTFQKFEIIKHSHSVNEMIANNDIDGVDSTTKRSGEHHNEPRQTGDYGGNEVRPNNVTVNYFIKVGP